MTSVQFLAYCLTTSAIMALIILLFWPHVRFVGKWLGSQIYVYLKALMTWMAFRPVYHSRMVEGRTIRATFIFKGRWYSPAFWLYMLALLPHYIWAWGLQEYIFRMARKAQGKGQCTTTVDGKLKGDYPPVWSSFIRGVYIYNQF